MTTARIRSLVPAAGGAQDLVITAVLEVDHHAHTTPPGRRRITPERHDRVKAAIRNSDRPYPTTPVSIDSNGFTGREHPLHDLAVAVAVLTASGEMPQLQDTVFLGGLGLDGSVRPTPEVQACLRYLRGRTDLRRVIVPAAELDGAPTLDGIRVLGATTLAQVVAYAHGRRDALTPAPSGRQPPERPIPSFLDGVVLPPWVARGSATAAAGRHHVLLTGPEPTDRSLLAHTLAALLPTLTDQQALVLARNRRHGDPVAEVPLDHTPPYRAPHRAASVSALIGGAHGPGEALLATHGVLHLTAAGHRSREQWEALLRIVDNRSVVLPVDGTPTGFTADPLIVVSCPDLASEMRQVPPSVYDRVSVRLHVPHCDRDHRTGQEQTEQEQTGQEQTGQDPVTLPVLADAVAAARLRAARRWRDTGVSTNTEVPADVLTLSSVFPRTSWQLLDRHHRAGVLSEHGVDEVRRVAWSPADLDACEHPEPRHVEQALALRLQSRPTPP
ncbi:ATP-binding protein [Saccharothrix lopnurensis]|uniref:ATP-binding protein n=1 Tax=Saccharothrix lopnurensis TaxID=1670621 RepID=A0ABW1PG81_9PSEU